MKLLLTFTIGILLATASSCKKNADCFDQQLYNQYKDAICTMDCPGVTACNGKTYCNECEANRNGYKLK